MPAPVVFVVVVVHSAFAHVVVVASSAVAVVVAAAKSVAAVMEGAGAHETLSLLGNDFLNSKLCMLDKICEFLPITNNFIKIQSVACITTRYGHWTDIEVNETFKCLMLNEEVTRISYIRKQPSYRTGNSYFWQNIFQYQSWVRNRK